MRLVFMGTPEFAVPSLRALLRASHTVTVVVTRPDRPRRHGGSRPEPSPVKAEALQSGLPVIEPETLRDPSFIERLREADPEAIAVVAFGRLLPPTVLETPPRGCINLHASILPRWRGAAPVARAIMAGDTRTGVSTMLMDRGLDTGGVLMVRETEIGPLETAGELSARLAVLGAGLLVETLSALDRSAVHAVPQDDAMATLAPPLSPEDARLSWDAVAGLIACRVRGCNPWPVASAWLRGNRLQILRAVEDLAPARVTACPPGTVMTAGPDGLIVACGAGTRLRILELRFPGRKAMSARDAFNGRLVREGERLTSPPS